MYVTYEFVQSLLTLYCINVAFVEWLWLTRIQTIFHLEIQETNYSFGNIGNKLFICFIHSLQKAFHLQIFPAMIHCEISLLLSTKCPNEIEVSQNIGTLKTFQLGNISELIRFILLKFGWYSKDFNLSFWRQTQIKIRFGNQILNTVQKWLRSKLWLLTSWGKFISYNV